MRAWIGLILALVAEAGPWAALVAYCLALPRQPMIDEWITLRKEEYGPSSSSGSSATVF